MNKMKIMNGYVVFPANWIVLNYQQPNNACYAGVVEVRNGIKYNIPHFIFFSKKPIFELTAEEVNLIIECCIIKYPHLSDVLSLYVPRIYDENNQIINELEWYQSPEACCFEIPDCGTRDTYVFDAMIVRN